MSKNLLLPHEVREILGVSRNTLPRWRQRGVGPTFITMPNGHHRYPAAALEKWMNDNMSTAA